MKNHFLRIFVAVACLLCSANAQGDWQPVGTKSLSAGVYSIYYSPGRTVRRNGLVRAWFKVVEPEASTTSHSLVLIQFNCSAGKYRLLQQSIFARYGSGEFSNKPTSWQYPEPESVPEMEHRTICH